jgi:hypothetical protein
MFNGFPSPSYFPGYSEPRYSSVGSAAMSDSTRAYRIQRLLVLGIFVCSSIALLLYLFPAIRYYFFIPADYNQLLQHKARLRPFHSFARIAFWLTFLLILAEALMVLFSSSFRIAWYDERARMNRLKAFRPAFFVTLIIQILTLLFMFIFGAQYYLTAQSVITISAGVLSFAGMTLFYSREIDNE